MTMYGTTNMESPTEKAIAMAQRMEQLEKWNNDLHEELCKERERHKHEMDVERAYNMGVKATLEALLGKAVNL